jgi:hypothetical protein
MERKLLDTSSFKHLISDPKYCAVTAKIIYDGQQVRFMYREEPVNDTDSGWQFLAGTETQDYLADLDNVAMYRLNTVANFDPAVVPYLDFPTGTDLERLEGSDEFVIIT